MKQIITTKNAPQPVGPYSQAQVVNGFLFTSGQIALDPDTSTLVTGDIRKETKRTLDNIMAILGEAGYSAKNVVKATICLTDINNFKIVNELYASFFSKDFPAREVVEVNKLPLNANIMISVIAAAS